MSEVGVWRSDVLNLFVVCGERAIDDSDFVTETLHRLRSRGKGMVVAVVVDEEWLLE